MSKIFICRWLLIQDSQVAVLQARYIKLLHIILDNLDQTLAHLLIQLITSAEF